MSAVYHFEVQSVGDDIVNRTYASAFGDLDTINYIAKKVVKEIEGVDGNFSLTLDEVDQIGGANTVRTVVDLTASARVVVTVLKGELTSERKAARVSGAEPTTEQPKNDGLGGYEVQTDTNDPTY